MPHVRRALALASFLLFFSHMALAQLPDFTGLVERNNAAVVNISTTQKVAQAHGQMQAPEGLESADVILVGISRTSKTPTCIYLAQRGIALFSVNYRLIKDGRRNSNTVHASANWVF